MLAQSIKSQTILAKRAIYTAPLHCNSNKSERITMYPRVSSTFPPSRTQLRRTTVEFPQTLYIPPSFRPWTSIKTIQLFSFPPGFSIVHTTLSERIFLRLACSFTRPLSRFRSCLPKTSSNAILPLSFSPKEAEPSVFYIGTACYENLRSL